MIFWGIWLGLWAVGGIAGFSGVILENSRPPLVILSVALIAWAAVGLWVASFWLWFAFGKEVITIAEGKLILRNEILGHGRSKEFPLARVKDLRASGLFGSFFAWSGVLKVYGLSGGVIAFEFEGGSHRFGKLLEEDEAREVVKELRNRISLPAQTTNPRP